eukprot:CAMPEP_0197197772 /NCGR_PEP_ID=MMETSP1423-20130617/33035_1 /TAXON_ID=476441 /ORGANISM="Pseudo-nitzschia heimii, Strain UNC1101" /LENGTH=1037 /DNA_ID=CAMNT_0042651597 /DNA_START=154 /DNA_END=3267 /DNA_ORIENTATION=-
MSVFAVCTAVAAAVFAAAFEAGRVAEKRLSGSSRTALPFDGFDWKSDDAKLAAKVFGAVFLVESTFLPRSLNPFSYVLLPSSDAGASAFLAFFVLGSWTGLLALGCGAVVSSLRGLHDERVAIEADRANLRSARDEADEDLRAEREELAGQKRQAVASSAAVAGEWKKLHIAREEHNAHAERSENEKIWSKTIREEFDRKTLHVVDNALDKRWREVEDQRLNLEQIRKRNKEKEQKIKEQRAQRAERASTHLDSLQTEKSNLMKLAKELEDLKANMERLKEDNIQKEQEKLQELKDRELALLRKEEDLEAIHRKKLERLRDEERTLNEREERFETGEERRRLQELSEKLESSKLNVARFNESVMMRERQKAEEIRGRELALQRREEEIARRADVFAKLSTAVVAVPSYPEPKPCDSADDMPDDEASQHSRILSQHYRGEPFAEEEEEEGPDDEKDPIANDEGPGEDTEATIIREDPSDEMESTANEPLTIREDEASKDAMQSGEHDGFLAMNQTVDTEDKSVSIRLLVERDIITVASEKDLHSSTNDFSKTQDTTASSDDDDDDTEDKSVAMRSLLVEQVIETVTSEERMHSSSTTKDLPTIREDGALIGVEKEEDLEPRPEETEPADPSPVTAKDDEATSDQSKHQHSAETFDEEESVGLNPPPSALPAALRAFGDGEVDENDTEDVEAKAPSNIASVYDPPEESSYRPLLDDDETDDEASSYEPNENDDGAVMTPNIVLDFVTALGQDDESVASTCLLNANDESGEAMPIRDSVETQHAGGVSVDDDDEEEDDNSAASTNMFNSNADLEAMAMATTEQTAPTFPALEESEQPPLFYDSDDDDSLFHQIQSDIEAKERAAAFDEECSGTASIGEPLEEEDAYASPVSSPLQERSENTAIIPPSTAAKKNDERITAEFILPISPTSTTKGSPSFQDAVISMIDSETDTDTSDGSGGGDSFKDATSSIAATVSDSDYVFTEQENDDGFGIGIREKNDTIASLPRSPRRRRRPAEDKVVVGEDGGVELIAWSERSVLSN